MGDPSSKSLTTNMFISCKRRYDRYGDNFETFFPETPPSNPILSEPLNFHRESKYWSLMKDPKNDTTSENLTDDTKTGDKIPFSMVFSSEGQKTAAFFIGSNQNQQLESSANLNGSSSDIESTKTGKVFTEIMEKSNVHSLSQNTSVPSSLHSSSFNIPQQKGKTTSDIEISVKSQKKQISDMDKSERLEKLREIAFSDLSEDENSPVMLKKNKSIAGFSEMKQAHVCRNDEKSGTLSGQLPNKITDEIHTYTAKQEKNTPANFPMKEHIITSSKPPKTSLSNRLINWSTATKVDISNKEMNVWAPVGS